MKKLRIISVTIQRDDDEAIFYWKGKPIGSMMMETVERLLTRADCFVQPFEWRVLQQRDRERGPR